jgi:hypothetical protein
MREAVKVFVVINQGKADICIRLALYTDITNVGRILIRGSAWNADLVTERSKARVSGRSLTGIVGSNPAGGMDACSVVRCEVKVYGTDRSLV